LRPAGKVLIDGETYDATAESGFIEKDEKIKVNRYINSQLFVRKIS
jgi:membrane-bound serine protease (ClpP class)